MRLRNMNQSKYARWTWSACVLGAAAEQLPPGLILEIRDQRAFKGINWFPNCGHRSRPLNKGSNGSFLELWGTEFCQWVQRLASPYRRLSLLPWTWDVHKPESMHLIHSSLLLTLTSDLSMRGSINFAEGRISIFQVIQFWCHEQHPALDVRWWQKIHS